MTISTLLCFPCASMALTVSPGPDNLIAGMLDWFTASALALLGVRQALTEL